MMLALGLVLLVGVTVITPLMADEEALAARRVQVWAEGQSATGFVTRRARSHMGVRKKMYYRYEVAGTPYEDERSVGHVTDFAAFVPDTPLEVKIDPQDPSFSVLALDTRQFVDRVPYELLAAMVLLSGCILAILGLWRRHLLRWGEEVPCTYTPGRSPALLRVSYEWNGVEYSRRVNGECASGAGHGVLLLSPRWPARPILVNAESFIASDTPARGSVFALNRRWRVAWIPATLGAWVAWSVVSLFTGEPMPPALRLGICLVVAAALVYISKAPPSASQLSPEDA